MIVTGIGTLFAAAAGRKIDYWRDSTASGLPLQLTRDEEALRRRYSQGARAKTKMI
jgi:hypothetical protein